jgi:hypothetical protein
LELIEISGVQSGVQVARPVFQKSTDFGDFSEK